MFLTADCHQRALKIFQANPSSPVLDLSHLSLRPLHISSLFTSLQGHTNLTSLNLSGNRLKNDAMTLLANTLARHASLHVLDLSCTGITAQVQCMYIGWRDSIEYCSYLYFLGRWKCVWLSVSLRAVPYCRVLKTSAIPLRHPHPTTVALTLHRGLHWGLYFWATTHLVPTVALLCLHCSHSHQDCWNWDYRAVDWRTRPWRGTLAWDMPWKVTLMSKLFLWTTWAILYVQLISILCGQLWIRQFLYHAHMECKWRILAWNITCMHNIFIYLRWCVWVS